MAKRHTRPARPAGDVRLTGSAVDEHGALLADVQVTLWPGAHSARTASDGSFAIDGLHPGQAWVYARSETHYLRTGAIRVGHDRASLTLRMKRGEPVVVRVVDADGNPVVDAHVTQDDAETRTDHDGVARLGAVSPGGSYVSIHAVGFVHAERVPVEKEVVLRRGAILAGIVRGPDNEPVADAEVEIASRSIRYSSTTVSTDAQGRWQVDAAAADSYDIRAASTTGGPASTVVVMTDGITAREDVELRVAPCATLGGDVVDAAGAGVPNARVIVGAYHYRLYETVTDEQGRFELLGVPAGEYDVFAIAGLRAATRADVRLADGERCALRMVVREATIRGRVIDGAGLPVNGMSVSASTTGRHTLASNAFDRTDAEGRFELDLLALGEYMVSCRCNSRCSLEADGRVMAGTSGVDLVIVEPGTISGRAMIGGVPLTSFGVLVNGHGHIFFEEPEAIDNADGRFSVSISEGTWTVLVAGIGTTLARRTEVTVASGQTVDIGDVEVQRGVRVHGRVIDASGSPVEGAHVELGRSMGAKSALALAMHNAHSTTTGAQGAFVLEGYDMNGDDRRIATCHPAFGMARHVTVEDATAEQVITLEATGGVDGTLREPRGAKRIQAVPHDERVFRVYGDLDPDGAFHLNDMLPGTYDLYADGFSGGVRAAIPCGKVLVVSDERATVELNVPETVTVIVHSDEPRSGLAFVLNTGEPKQHVAQAPWSAGRAEILGIVPGAYELQDRAKDGRIPFTVEPGVTVQHLKLSDGRLAALPTQGGRP